MNNQEASACKGTAYDIVLPFIGTWNEFTIKGDEEILEGTLVVQLELNGCAITQHFTSVDGTFSFLSFGFVEAKTNQWLETYIFDNGRSTQWRWREDGDEIIQEYVGGFSNEIIRLRIVNLTEDEYDVIDEQFVDHDKGWRVHELTRVRRIG